MNRINYKNLYNILDTLQNRKLHKILMIYLMIGIILFMKDYNDLTYINFIYMSMGHSYILSFFILPVSFIECCYLSYCVRSNKSIINRFSEKKEYLSFECKLVFLNSCKMFLIYIFMTLLCANLFAEGSGLIHPDPNYPEVFNIIGVIFHLIKLFLMLIGINNLYIYLNRLIDIRFITVGAMFIMLCFFDFFPLGKFEILLPSYYIGFKNIFPSFNDNLLFSILYFLFIILVLILMKRIVQKKDVL